MGGTTTQATPEELKETSSSNPVNKISKSPSDKSTKDKVMGLAKGLSNAGAALSKPTPQAGLEALGGKSKVSNPDAVSKGKKLPEKVLLKKTAIKAGKSNVHPN